MNTGFKDGICPRCGRRIGALLDEPLCCPDCGWEEGEEDATDETAGV